MQSKGISRRKSKRGKKEVEKPKLIFSGPLLQAPFGWTPPLGKNLLHKLTKEIVKMKLSLYEEPVYKECIRVCRQRVNIEDFDAEDAKSTIMKMAAVTPSVFLDDVILRVGQGDQSAAEDLELIIILTESETVEFK